MSDQDRRSPADDEWRDIHLDDIISGVSSFIALVSGVVEAVGSAVNQPRPDQPAVPLRPSSPARLGAGAAIAGVRDPVVELFDEGEEIVLTVEWPYVDEGQIQIDLHGDVLSLTIGGAWPYSTDLLLPGVFDAASLRQRHRNGITEVRVLRQREDQR